MLSRYSNPPSVPVPASRYLSSLRLFLERPRPRPQTPPRPTVLCCAELSWAAQNSKARSSTSPVAKGQKAREEGGGERSPAPTGERVRRTGGTKARFKQQRQQKPGEKVSRLLFDTTPFVGNDEDISEIIGKKFKSSAIGHVSVRLFARGRRDSK